MSSALYLSDQWLEKKIKERMHWDIRVSSSDILIKVNSGKVTLYGYFDKPYRHAAVVEIIKNTEGVHDFKDLSHVIKDYYRGDREIESILHKKLESLQLIKGEWIEVRSTDGVVKLEGVVYRNRLKGFAASYAWQLSGVKDCLNLIQIKRLPQKEIFVEPYQQKQSSRGGAQQQIAEAVALGG